MVSRKADSEQFGVQDVYRSVLDVNTQGVREIRIKPREKSADSTRSSGAETARKPGEVVLCLFTAAARRHYLWAIPGRDVNRTMQVSVTGQSLKWLTCWPLE